MTIVTKNNNILNRVHIINKLAINKTKYPSILEIFSTIFQVI